MKKAKKAAAIALACALTLLAFQGSAFANPVPDLAIEVPSLINGAAGTEFTAKLVLNTPIENTKLIEAVLEIPEGVGVESVELGNINTAAQIDSNLKDGKLRIVLIDANGLSSTSITETEVPIPLFIINLKLLVGFGGEGEAQAITIKALSFRTMDSATEPPKEFDVKDVSATTEIEGGEGEGTVKALWLYQGDDVDLIPTNLKAYSVSFTDIAKGSEPGMRANFNGEFVSLFFSPERSKGNLATYVMLVDSAVKQADLENIDNYTSTGGPAEPVETILFGDTDDNQMINAADALNVLGAWLRKPEIATPEGKAILIDNVTADSRIDTVDALAIVEKFVNETEFSIVTKNIPPQ